VERVSQNGPSEHLTCFVVFLRLFVAATPLK